MRVATTAGIRPPMPGHNHAHSRTRRSRDDGDEARADPGGRSIALRFDFETKRRLEEMAESIGPRRFGALIRVACRRLVTQPKAVGNGLDEQRRLSEALRAIPLLMLKIKLEPDTAQKFSALAAEHDTTVSALMRIALHRFFETPGRYKHPMLREADRTGLSDWVDVMVNPSNKQQIWRLAGPSSIRPCFGSPSGAYSTNPVTSPEIFRSEKHKAHLMARHARRQARRHTLHD